MKRQTQKHQDPTEPSQKKVRKSPQDEKKVEDPAKTDAQKSNGKRKLDYNADRINQLTQAARALSNLGRKSSRRRRMIPLTQEMIKWAEKSDSSSDSEAPPCSRSGCKNYCHDDCCACDACESLFCQESCMNEHQCELGSESGSDSDAEPCYEMNCKRQYRPDKGSICDGCDVRFCGEKCLKKHRCPYGSNPISISSDSNSNSSSRSGGEDENDSDSEKTVEAKLSPTVPEQSSTNGKTQDSASPAEKLHWMLIFGPNEDGETNDILLTSSDLKTLTYFRNYMDMLEKTDEKDSNLVFLLNDVLWEGKLSPQGTRYTVPDFKKWVKDCVDRAIRDDLSCYSFSEDHSDPIMTHLEQCFPEKDELGAPVSYGDITGYGVSWEETSINWNSWCSEVTGGGPAAYVLLQSLMDSEENFFHTIRIPIVGSEWCSKQRPGYPMKVSKVWVFVSVVETFNQVVLTNEQTGEGESVRLDTFEILYEPRRYTFRACADGRKQHHYTSSPDCKKIYCDICGDVKFIS